MALPNIDLHLHYVPLLLSLISIDVMHWFASSTESVMSTANKQPADCCNTKVRAAGHNTSLTSMV